MEERALCCSLCAEDHRYTDLRSALGQTAFALFRSPRAAATGSDPAVSFFEKRLLWSFLLGFELGRDSNFFIALSLTVAITTLNRVITSVAV